MKEIKRSTKIQMFKAAACILVAVVMVINAVFLYAEEVEGEKTEDPSPSVTQVDSVDMPEEEEKQEPTEAPKIEDVPGADVPQVDPAPADPAPDNTNMIPEELTTPEPTDAGTIEEPPADATETPAPTGESENTLEETPSATPGMTPTASVMPEMNTISQFSAEVDSSTGISDAAMAVSNGSLPETYSLRVGNSDVTESEFLEADSSIEGIKTFDVHIVDENGTVVSLPDGAKATVTINFSEPVFGGLVGGNTTYIVLHKLASGIETLNDATYSADASGLKSITFTTNSFSSFAVGYRTTVPKRGLMKSSAKNADVVESVDLRNYITDVSITNDNGHKITEIDVSSTNEEKTNNFKVDISFTIPTNDLKNGEEWSGKATYPLGEIVNLGKLGIDNYTTISGDITNNNNTVGTYSTDENGLVTFSFDEELGNGTEITGSFFFWAYINTQNITTSTEVPISFGNEENGKITIKVNVPEDIAIEKRADIPKLDREEGTIAYNYVVKVSSSTGTEGSIEFNDVLTLEDANRAFSMGKIKVVEKNESGTQINDLSEDNLISYKQEGQKVTSQGTLPKLSQGHYYEITYSTTETVGKEASGWHNESNVATAKTGEKEVSATSNPKIDCSSKDTVTKQEDTPEIDDDGNVIWYYTVTIYSEEGTKEEVEFQDILWNKAVGKERKVEKIVVKKLFNGTETELTNHSLQAGTGDSSEEQYEAITGTLPELSAGESYVITYQVKETGISGDYSGTIEGLNKAMALKTEDWANPQILYTGNSAVPKVSKEGSIYGTEIKWTITLNSDYANLDGYKLTDTLMKGEETQSLDGVIFTVKEYNKDNSQVNTFDEVKLPVTFSKNDSSNAVMRDKNNKEYELKSVNDKLVFEYITQVSNEDASHTTKYENMAEISDGENGSDSASKEVTYNPPLLDKSDAQVTENGDEITLSWQITLTIPEEGIKKNEVLKDYLEYVPTRNSWFTPDKLNLKIEGIDETDYEVYVGDDGQPIAGLDKNEKFWVYSIKFLKDIERTEELTELIITYDSVDDVSDLQSGQERQYKNTAEYNNSRDSGTGSYTKAISTGGGVEKYNYTEGGESKSDISYSYVNTDTIRLYYRVVLDLSGANDGFTYTDELPNGAVLVTDDWDYGGISYQSSNGMNCQNGVLIRYLDNGNESDTGRNDRKPYGTGYYYIYDSSSEYSQITSSSNNNIIVVENEYISGKYVPYKKNDNNSENYDLVLYYAVDIKLTDEEISEIGNKGSVNKVNRGILDIGSGNNYSSTATTTIEKGKIDKSAGEYNTGTNTLEYTLNINPDGLLINGGNNLEIVDTINYINNSQKNDSTKNGIESVAILPGSVMLFERGEDGGQGSLVDSSDYTVSFSDEKNEQRGVLRVSVPDGKAYILKYTYLFKYKNVGLCEVTLTNSASLNGWKEWTDSVSNEYKAFSSGATASTDNTKLTLAKRDADNAGVFLKGAEYNLEVWDNSSKKWTYVRSFETNENGIVELGEEAENGNLFIRYNYAYRLKETKAPDGYVLDETYKYICLESSCEAESIPNDCSSVAYFISKYEPLEVNNSYVFVADKKAEEYKISVQKIWEDSTGNRLDADKIPSDEITVSLIRSTNKKKPESGVGFRTATLSKDNTWQYTFENLPTVDAQSRKPYYYFVKEVGEETAGYVVSYSNKNDDVWTGVQTGEIVITNQVPAVGSLEITKQFTGLTIDEIDQLKDYKITVAGSDEGNNYRQELTFTSESLTVNENTYKWTLSNVPAGNYTVKESGHNLEKYDVEVKIDGSKVVPAEKNVSVQFGKPTNVSFVNEYKPKVGKLIIEKSFVGLSKEELPQDFKISVTGNGKSKELTLQNKESTGENENEYQWILDELPVGEYTITESGFELNNYSVNVQINGVATAINEHTAMATTTVEQKEDNKVVLTNKYDKKTVSTSFQVQKMYAGWENEGDNHTFEFSLSPYKENDKPDAPMPKGDGNVVTISKSNTGVGTFGEITYDQTGTYMYQIEEIIPKDKGNITYDTSKWIVMVTVEDAGVDGNTGRPISVSYSKEDSDSETDANNEAAKFTNKIETVDISVEKKWVYADGEKPDGEAPTVEVQLYKSINGAEEEIVGESVKLNGKEEKPWKYTWSNLPKYENGTEVSYRVDEETVPAYYKKSIANKDNDWTITNTYSPEYTQVHVKKVWEDNSNASRTRPDKITIQLVGKTKDETTVYDKEMTIDASDLEQENIWEKSFDKLFKYTEDGKEIIYTVSEATVTDYKEPVITWDNDYTDGNGYIITNTLDTITIEGSKNWKDSGNKDKRPEDITINLFRSVGEDKVVECTAIVSSSDGWKWKFENLPKTKNGEQIIYTISEGTVPDYTPDTEDLERTVKGANGELNLTNYYTPGKTPITVVKKWEDEGDQDGKRPSAVKVQLYRRLTDEADTDAKPYGNEETLSANPNEPSKNWQYTWPELDSVDAEGRSYVYTVRETSVIVKGGEITIEDYKDYTPSVDGFTITNKHKPEKIQIKGEKTWQDDNNRDGIRPDQITVSLYKKVGEDGQEEHIISILVEPSDLNNNTWEYDFGMYPKYERGQEIHYSVKETVVQDDGSIKVSPPDGYEASYNGYNITNRHTPVKTNVTVNKVWDDTGRDIEVDHTGIEVKLIKYVGNSSKEIHKVTLSNDNDWSMTWSELPAKERIVGITYDVTYKVEEVEVEGYDVSYNVSDNIEDGKNNIICTITNTYQVPEPTSTPSPSPDATTTPGTPEPSNVPTSTPDATSTPGTTPSATQTPGPSATPRTTPSATQTPGPSATPGTTPSATETPGPSATPGTTPGATATPAATPETTPGQTPAPEETPTPEVVPTPDNTPNPVVTPGNNSAPTPRGTVLGARKVKVGGTRAAVLGARRGADFAVLGKRRKPSTGDSMALLIWIITMSVAMGGAITSSTMLSLENGRKRRRRRQ